MANKKIRLHPFVNGVQDKNTNLYPETSIDAVNGLQQALDNKQGELTAGEGITIDGNIISCTNQGKIYQAGNGLLLNDQTDTFSVDEFNGEDTQDTKVVTNKTFIQNCKYDTVEQEVPAELEDGKQYTLPTSYDLDDFTFDNSQLYGNEGNVHISLSTNMPSGKGIIIETESTTYFYTDYTAGETWYYIESGMEEPLPYENSISITYDENELIEGKELELTKVFGLEPTIVEVDRTLEDKVKDLQNWIYETLHRKRINFNANDYVQYLNSDFNYYLYSHYDSKQNLNISYTTTQYICLSIMAYMDNSYKYFYFVFDFTNPNLGTWRDQSYYGGNEWSSEDLARLTFVYHGFTPSSERYAEFLKAIITNEDGSPVNELVEGNTYKLNPNVSEYRDVIDSFTTDDLYTYLYSWSADDSNLRQIEISSLYYYNVPYYTINLDPEKQYDKYYYLLPRIGTNSFPGIWANSSSYSSSNLHIYTKDELKDIFVEVEDAYKNSNLSETGEVLYNAIVENVTTDISLNDKFNELNELIANIEPLEDKLYGQESFIDESIDWSAFYDDKDPIYSLELYNEYNRIIVNERYDDDQSVFKIEILDNINHIDYLIYSDNCTYNNFSFESNTWYKVDMNSSSPQPKEIKYYDVDVQFETKYISDTLFYTVVYYEEVTLKQKFLEVKNALNYIQEEIDNFSDDTILKDKIYDTVTKELEEGDSVAPKNDIDLSEFYPNSGWNDIYEASGSEETYIGLYYRGASRPGMLETKYLQYTHNGTFRNYGDGVWIDLDTNEEVDKLPTFIYNSSYIINQSDFEKVVGSVITQEITLGEKIADLQNWTYDQIETQLEDGKEYPLTDNYDEFFEKYGTEQSQLIYGNPSNSSGSTIIEEPLLAGSSKAGDVPTILTIYLSTDNTPIRGGENLTKDKILDAEPALGSPDITITTSDNYTFHFFANANSWQEYYNGSWQDVPLQYVPRLILDSSLIYNEDMLRDFLQLGYKDQTLKEKLDGFKDWLYDSGEPQANVFYTLPSSYDYTNINTGRIYQAGITPGPTPIEPGGQLVGMSISNGKSSLSTNEEQTVNTRTSGTKSLTKASSSDLGVVDVYSIWVYKYSDGGQINIQGTINGDDYTFIQYESENGWYCDNDDNTYEHISIRLENTNYIYDEQSLKEILALKPLTLEEKINSMSSSSDEPLENKLYAHYDQVCELLSVPNWEGMGDSLTGYINIYSYEHSDSGFNDTIYIGDLYDDNHYGVLMDIVSGESENRYEIYNEDWSDTEYASGFEVKKNTWYRTVWDYKSSPTTKSYTEEIPELEVQDNGVKNIDLFKCVYKYSPDTNQTLKEKFDSYKDWTYDKKDATYRLLTPDWANIDTTNTGTIYENRTSIHSPSDDELNYCKYAALNEAYEIETYETDEIYDITFEKVIGFDQSDDAITEVYYNFNKDCVVGYGSTQQLTKGVWYKGTYDEELDYTVFEEVANVEMLFRDYYIKDGYEELFESLIQYIPEEITTLDEKLKYLITDYTEDSGALTSITVKDKETGDPTILSVGGGGTTYKHHIYCYRANSYRVTFTIENDNPNAMTWSDVASYLYNKGFTDDTKVIQLSGKMYNGNTSSWVNDAVGVYATGSNNLCLTFNNSGLYSFISVNSGLPPTTFVDTRD